MQIVPPRMLLGEEDVKFTQEALKKLKNLSALYGVKIDVETFHGNPVIEALSHIKDDSMLILSYQNKVYYREFFIPNSAYVPYEKVSREYSGAS